MAAAAFELVSHRTVYFCLSRGTAAVQWVALEVKGLSSRSEWCPGVRADSVPTGGRFSSESQNTRNGSIIGKLKSSVRNVFNVQDFINSFYQQLPILSLSQCWGTAFTSI